MEHFDTFGAYMFDLLNAPLKAGKRGTNQFYIFFKVMGREFDDVKAALFAARDATSVASAGASMLAVIGQERDMPRLIGEDTEAYRKRLGMKGVISEWGGTTQGILYALSALGYDQSSVEPFSLQDSSRWAEFIVLLRGSKQSGVNDIAAIDTEVAKVKQASSKPSYGAECGNTITLASVRQSGTSKYPPCGTIASGVWPEPTSTGLLAASRIVAIGRTEIGTVEHPLCGTIVASTRFYDYGNAADFKGFASSVTLKSTRQSGISKYPLCSDATYSGGIE